MSWTRILLLGLGLCLHSIWICNRASYGLLSYAASRQRLFLTEMRFVVFIQTVSSDFFMSVLGLKTDSRHLPNT